MNHDESKRKQADPALFGKISKWIGEFRRKGKLVKSSFEHPVNEKLPALWSKKIKHFGTQN